MIFSSFATLASDERVEESVNICLKLKTDSVYKIDLKTMF